MSLSPWHLGNVKTGRPWPLYALFIMMLIAEQQGHRFLVLANDRSSNEFNATYQGREVNHQSAKGAAYIERFNNFLEKI